MPFNKRRESSRKNFENSLIEFITWPKFINSISEFSKFLLIEFITWPKFFVTSKKQVEENQEENELKVHLAQK